MEKFDVEVHADGWWFMFGDDHNFAIDMGVNRNRITRTIAIWLAYLRQWRRRRRNRAVAR